MEGRGSNTWLVAALALAVGFLGALLILGGKDNENTSATVSQTASTTMTDSPGASAQPGTTTAAPGVTSTGQAPATPPATTSSCIDLWNQTNNRGNQTFLVNVMSQQPIRVHVGVTTDVPPECLVTVVGNNGDAYVFPEGGGSTFPYAASPGKTDSGSLSTEQKTSNALEQRDGTLAA